MHIRIADAHEAALNGMNESNPLKKLSKQMTKSEM